MDSHLYQGYRVPHDYDSLIGKLICVGADRSEALARMSGALRETKIGPIATNLDLHKKILSDPDFQVGAVSTAYLEEAAFAGGHG